MSEAGEIITGDRRRLAVQTYLVYRITDASQIKIGFRDRASLAEMLNRSTIGTSFSGLHVVEVGIVSIRPIVSP
jgi:hypothetical protein